MEEKFNQLSTLIETIPRIKNIEEVFNLICKISVVAETYTNKELQSLCYYNNLYVNPIWNVFHSDLFFISLKTLLNSSYEDRCANKLLKEEQIVQLFLRLSFFMVSVLVHTLNESTIFFLRRHFSASLKHIYNKLSNVSNTDMRKLLLILEDINFDSKYGFKKKIPITLNKDFLNMNQLSSRILVGPLVLSNISYWILPQLFEDVTKIKIHPGKLFTVTERIRFKTDYYQNYNPPLNNEFFNKERVEKLKNFVSLLRDQNIEDLVFLINKVGPSRGQKMDEGYKENKIELATHIREIVQKRLETLDVFIESNKISNRWSNKAFLNTLIFFSALESIKQAKNISWRIGTFNHFLNKWFNDMNEIVNYYDIESSKTVVIYVEGLSDKIILENAYEKLHPKHTGFIFYHMGGKKELVKKINAAQIYDLERRSIGIFDFDEAYNDFNGLRGVSENSEISGFDKIQGKEQECIFRVREDNENKVFAILLPVPESRKEISSRELGGKSLLSIEMLFEDELLKKTGNLKQEFFPGGSSINIFTGDKIKFSEKTKTFDKFEFKNFKPLFKKLFEISKD